MRAGPYARDLVALYYQGLDAGCVATMLIAVAAMHQSEDGARAVGWWRRYVYDWTTWPPRKSVRKIARDELRLP